MKNSVTNKDLIKECAIKMVQDKSVTIYEISTECESSFVIKCEIDHNCEDER